MPAYVDCLPAGISLGQAPWLSDARTLTRHCSSGPSPPQRLRRLSEASQEGTAHAAGIAEAGGRADAGDALRRHAPQPGDDALRPWSE